MNKSVFLFLSATLICATATLCNQRLAKLSYAVEKGNLTHIDQLVSENHYTSAEYDFLIAEAEGIMHESKSWWFAVWLMMIFGGLIAFRACWEALKLARKAPKYNSASAIIAGAIILALGAGGVYIGLKGFNKYTLYTTMPEIVLRLQAAKKSAATKITLED